MAQTKFDDHLLTLEDALADGRVADFLPGCEDDLAAVVAELKAARKSLTVVTDTVADASSWDNPSSALERIGDAVDSERYPVWERYNS